MLKLAFSGSRFKFFRNVQVGCFMAHDLVDKVLAKHRILYADGIVVGHGGNVASVDVIVDYVARSHGFKVLRFTPLRWDSKEELHRRNRELAEWCDKLIAIFVDEYSPGTLSTLRYALERGKHVEAYFIDTEKRRIIELDPEQVVKRERSSNCSILDV